MDRLVLDPSSPSSTCAAVSAVNRLPTAPGKAGIRTRRPGERLQERHYPPGHLGEGINNIFKTLYQHLELIALYLKKLYKYILHCNTYIYIGVVTQVKYCK